MMCCFLIAHPHNSYTTWTAELMDANPITCWARGWSLLFLVPCRRWQRGLSSHSARVNQQPPMHQLAVLSTGWAAFFHSTSYEVHHNPLFFTADHCIFFLGLFLTVFFLDLTSHIATLLTFLLFKVLYQPWYLINYPLLT